MKYFEYKKPLNETYPEDCEKIWEYLNEVGKPNFSRSNVENLWRDFSDDVASASFLIVNDDLLEEFAEWLSEKEI